jgi:hypothetical protein
MKRTLLHQHNHSMALTRSNMFGKSLRNGECPICLKKCCHIALYDATVRSNAKLLSARGIAQGILAHSAVGVSCRQCFVPLLTTQREILP